ncbi:hypothetical protein QUF56_14905 [Ureibacillus composti]|nr:hypothetical protein [Lysinibacillus composti]MBM7607082.1 hypothetical protein [Lysinibacillus composti]MDM5334525.1 hypothetical protein [Ureibacillus composti]
MLIDDVLLEKLGVYFVYHNYYDDYGITFETFVKRYIEGIWEI